MYKSPIELVYGQNHRIIEEMYEEQDKWVLKCINNVGLNVNKDELIKALQYDRQQYEKGYKDGLEQLSEDAITDWMVKYIQMNSIKCLMELVMKAIEKENENGIKRHD